MKILLPAYAFCMLLAVCFVSTCSTHPTEPGKVDSLALQHKLMRSIDSIDSAWRACGAPPSCTCHGLEIYCPDDKPGAP